MGLCTTPMGILHTQTHSYMCKHSLHACLTHVNIHTRMCAYTHYPAQTPQRHHATWTNLHRPILHVLRARTLTTATSSPPASAPGPHAALGAYLHPLPAAPAHGHPLPHSVCRARQSSGNVSHRSGRWGHGKSEVWPGHSHVLNSWGFGKSRVTICFLHTDSGM